MKSAPVSAFTKVDLIVVIATVAFLFVLLTYAYPRLRPPRSSRINCVSNLKQVGLGFRMWSNDHGDLFPWQVPAAEGGTKEFANLPYPALHFTVVSNELNSPVILRCSFDAARTRATSWQTPLALHLSYFAGIDADETKPSTFLAGDRSISTNSSSNPGLLTIDKASRVGWTTEIHKHGGNIGLADGSVFQSTTETLQKPTKTALDKSVNGTIRLSIP